MSSRVSKGAIARANKKYSPRHRAFNWRLRHKITGKYMPHQGAQECARRLRKLTTSEVIASG